MKKRVFLIVLDSLGAGEALDAKAFGDEGAHTLRSIYHTGELKIDTLRSLGIGNIDGLDFLGATENPSASVARLAERSNGKDTVVGHWELAGRISAYPHPTFPCGFPESMINRIADISGREILCNKPYSGTKVIEDYGNEALARGALIVYTSADSVLQIAAHTDVVSLCELYDICLKLRKEFIGEVLGVGRIIARPFTTDNNGKFVRTSDRKDFSLQPPKDLLPEIVKKNQLDSIAIGKINDIFSGVGFTETQKTHSNEEGMAYLDKCFEKDFSGLCFANLVDFDMLWGHRRDAVAYAKGLSDFDLWLSEFVKKLLPDDALIITADHGCDPCFERSTDHTREFVPYIEYSPNEKAQNWGTQTGFDFVSNRVCRLLELKK